MDSIDELKKSYKAFQKKADDLLGGEKESIQISGQYFVPQSAN
jgi:hypothetical protein